MSLNVYLFNGRHNACSQSAQGQSGKRDTAYFMTVLEMWREMSYDKNHVTVQISNMIKRFVIRDDLLQETRFIIITKSRTLIYDGFLLPAKYILFKGLKKLGF